MEQMGFFRNLEHFYGPPILRLGSWTWRFFLRVPSRLRREGTKEIVRLGLSTECALTIVRELFSHSYCRVYYTKGVRFPLIFRALIHEFTSGGSPVVSASVCAPCRTVAAFVGSCSRFYFYFYRNAPCMVLHFSRCGGG